MHVPVTTEVCGKPAEELCVVWKEHFPGVKPRRLNYLKTPLGGGLIPINISKQAEAGGH